MAFDPKDELVRNQVLKVESLDISGSDGGMFSISGGNCFVNINEPVHQIFLVRCKVDSSNTTTEFAQASLSIVDSVDHTPAGNQKCIKIAGLGALAVGDCLSLKYSVLEHL